MNFNNRKAIISFFTKIKNPPDKLVHKFAEKMNIDPKELEEEIYSILSDFFAYGKYNEISLDHVSKEELKKGIKIEMEHTRCPMIARRIALDHLSEMNDYYTKLEKMEQGA